MDADLDSRAGRTRTAIIAAARAQFTETGYDGTGLRAIASRAGVNVALISRYFGSKDGLFLAAIGPHLGLGLILHGPMATFGVRAASVMEMKVARRFDPMLALLRAAGSPACGPALSSAVRAQVIAPLAARLDGDNTHQRAMLIFAMLAGYDLSVSLLQLDGTGDEDGLAGRGGRHGRRQRQALLADSLQYIVDDG